MMYYHCWFQNVSVYISIMVCIEIRSWCILLWPVIFAIKIRLHVFRVCLHVILPWTDLDFATTADLWISPSTISTCAAPHSFQKPYSTPTCFLREHPMPAAGQATCITVSSSVPTHRSDSRHVVTIADRMNEEWYDSLWFYNISFGRLVDIWPIFDIWWNRLQKMFFNGYSIRIWCNICYSNCCIAGTYCTFLELYTLRACRALIGCANSDTSALRSGVTSSTALSEGVHRKKFFCGCFNDWCMMVSKEATR